MNGGEVVGSGHQLAVNPAFAFYLPDANFGGSQLAETLASSAPIAEDAERREETNSGV